MLLLLDGEGRRSPDKERDGGTSNGNSMTLQGPRPFLSLHGYNQVNRRPSEIEGPRGRREADGRLATIMTGRRFRLAYLLTGCEAELAGVARREMGGRRWRDSR